MSTLNVYLTIDENGNSMNGIYKSMFDGEISLFGKIRVQSTNQNESSCADISNKVVHLSIPISEETIVISQQNVSGISSLLHDKDEFSLTATPLGSMKLTVSSKPWWNKEN